MESPRGGRLVTSARRLRWPAVNTPRNLQSELLARIPLATDVVVAAAADDDDSKLRLVIPPRTSTVVYTRLLRLHVK